MSAQRPSITLCCLWIAACQAGDPVQLYATDPKAPSLEADGIAALDHLGPTIVDQGVNFGVYSANATRVELLLFEDPEADRPAQRFEMKRFGDVWNLYVEGVGRGQDYGYVAWGPNWTYDPDWYPGSVAGFVADVDGEGNRFNPNKLLMDPWAKAISREHDWSRASIASGPARAESTWGASAKSVVVTSEHVWSDGEAEWIAARKEGRAPYHGWNELVLYEVHPKGFTQDAASGVAHPGTFRGVAEKADYLRDLGVNALELLPVHEKPLDGGYWGYNNLSFFAPEMSYATDPDPMKVTDEFKAMVDVLHQHGIEVILDVVYNHTGEGGLWRERVYQSDVSLDPATDAAFYNFDPQEVAGLYSYRGLDNASYYALSKDGLTYWNNTGVGNETRPNHAPMRRLILDSLHYMVEELHVDGFRFDLAPVLGEKDLDYDVWSPEGSVLQDIADDPVLIAHHTRIMAEPWSACYPCYNPVVGKFPKSTVEDGVGWGEWNARFRDWWREFVNDDNWKLSTREAEADGGFTLTGSFDLYGDDGRRPYHSVNFVTVHDGFTMYDLVTYPQKQNGCGPLNPVCCDDPASSWCDNDSGENNNHSRDWGSGVTGEAMKRQMMRNWFVALMVSQGTPLILGGDEWLRTQLGNNNAYANGADNPYNWYAWGTWQQDDARVRMHDFVRQAVALRMQNLSAFAPSTYGGSAPFAWKSAAGTEPPDWNSRQLMWHFYDATQGAQVVVLFNMERGPVTFTLPAGVTWQRVIDTQRWFDLDDPGSATDFFDTTGASARASHNASMDAPQTVDGGTYQVQDSSIVVLRAEE